MPLPDQVAEAILAHARACSPDECCGLLAVDPAGRIRFAYPLTNASPSPVTFTIDPEEHLAALLHAERNGWEIGGLFHSHPRGPARPSLLDVRNAPDRRWLYAVSDLEKVRLFRIDGGVVEIET